MWFIDQVESTHRLRAVLAGGQVVALSVPAPSERFRAHEQIIVAALWAAAETPKCPWYRADTSQ